MSRRSPYPAGVPSPPAFLRPRGLRERPSRAVAGRAATFGLFARVTLSVALAVGMLFWPYEVRCGGGLALYLGAVSVVVASGVWSAVWSWRHRSGRAHSLSLLLLLWGLVLGSLEILPRVGYAKPDARHPASWACR